jgi:hypothetical protein
MATPLQTTNQIEVGLAQEKVAELYTCHDLLPSWSPGFLSFEVICDGIPGGLPTFRQRYMALGREIEEVLTLVKNNLPNGFCVLADNGGTLTRKSAIAFEQLGETTTRITVLNTFSGEYVGHLVKEDLQNYTQQFLETFRAFAESQ